LQRATTKPWQAGVPVICVGNLTVGGTGKTPIAIALGQYFSERGIAVHFITRGYGGKAAMTRVDPARHSATDVGDEALLLVRTAPTWTGADRRKSASKAIEAGAELLIFDDGFQNPSVAKDISVVVIDGEVGFGNGRVIPSGPLRERPGAGLARADTVIIMGDDNTGAEEAAQRLKIDAMPVFRVRLMPAEAGAGQIGGQRVFAFAGIGRPQKFFATLKQMGCDIAGSLEFADHHPYKGAEIDDIIRRANDLNAIPVTTEKDKMRISSANAASIQALAVDAVFENDAVFKSWLDEKFQEARRGR